MEVPSDDSHSCIHTNILSRLFPAVFCLRPRATRRPSSLDPAQESLADADPATDPERPPGEGPRAGATSARGPAGASPHATAAPHEALAKVFAALATRAPAKIALESPGAGAG
jgi:hypothetical protein